METPYVLKTLTPDELTALSRDVKRMLTDLYGDRLDRVILYGSYARGDYHEESDVDYMVVLRDDDFRLMTEVDKYWDLTWTTWLTYGVWLSIKPVYTEKYRCSDLFFHRNVRREGIAL